MWTRAELKQNAKLAMRRNYWNCVLVALILTLLCDGASDLSLDFNSNSENLTLFTRAYSKELVILILGVAIFIVLFYCLFSIFVSNVIRVGSARFFLENREHETTAGTMFSSFKGGHYGKNVWIIFLQNLYIFGWSLLLIVPGIVKGYAYLLVPYLMAENPDLDRKRVFRLSEEMMQGHKMEAFILELSFLGWRLVSTMTCGILGVFYVEPYVEATYAEFYTALKAQAKATGITNDMELPGV